MVILLAAAAYVTNLLPVSLSYGLHFLFGGLFSILAALLYGPWGGGLVAAASSLPTIALWGHPYAVLTLTLEGVVVGLLVRNRRLQHTESDLLYWLLLGMPLVLLTYTLGGGLSLRVAGVAAVKQAVNGLCYTALASVVDLGLGWRKGGSFRLPLESYLSRLIALLVIGPLVTALGWSAVETGQSLRQTASAEAARAADALAVRIEQWERAGGELPSLTSELSEFIPVFSLEVAITDNSERVFFSNWVGVEVGSHFAPSPGEAAFFHRPPSQEASLGQAERVAFVERHHLEKSGWTIYTRKPLVAIETLLQQAYLRRFILSLSLMVGLLAAIRLVSYGVTRPLVKLAGVTVTPEGDLVGLSPDKPVRVSEVYEVIDHLAKVGKRMRGLVQVLQENQRELERSNVELTVANVHLANEALRDPLTGLLNGRAFWEQTEQWVEENRPFTLVLADLEGLSAIAQAEGQLASEAISEAFAKGLSEYVSLHGGEAYRYSSERFACLFPQADAWVAQRFSLAVPALVTAPKPLAIQVGSAWFPEAGPTARGVFAAADRVLEMANGG